MPTLLIYPRSDREQATAIWPNPATPLPAGLIQEAHTYSFELRDVADPSSADLQIDDRPLKALRNPNATTAKWEWTPDFYAGEIRLRLRYSPSTDFEIALTVDADLAKLARTEFDTMVRDILEDTTALFALSSFRVGVARGTGRTVPPLARLEYLRSRIRGLERVVRDIDARPVRVLETEPRVRPIAAARRINAVELYRAFQHHRLAAAPPGTRIGTRAVEAVPIKVTITSKAVSSDIAENRAIKTALMLWRSWLNRSADVLDNTAGVTEEEQVNQRKLWARRCMALSRRIGKLLDLPLFSDVSNTRTAVEGTPIFSRVPQYIRFMELYRDISLGIAQVEGSFLDLPLSRTFELYELWVFLRLCRAAVQHFGITLQLKDFFVEDQSRLGIARLIDSPSLNLGPGLTLRFKRQYREYWKDAAAVGSFTRTMIPDMAVECSQTASSTIIVLDAKYRIGTQLNDAISSIHTYRDAIVHEDETEVRRVVVASYLLTPESFTPGDNWQDSDMPARLFHPEYRGKFRFGAVTLRPGRPLSDAVSVLQLILADAIAPPYNA